MNPYWSKPTKTTDIRMWPPLKVVGLVVEGVTDDTTWIVGRDDIAVEAAVSLNEALTSRVAREVAARGEAYTTSLSAKGGVLLEGGARVHTSGVFTVVMRASVNDAVLGPAYPLHLPRVGGWFRDQVNIMGARLDNGELWLNPDDERLVTLLRSAREVVEMLSQDRRPGAFTVRRRLGVRDLIRIHVHVDYAGAVEIKPVWHEDGRDVGELQPLVSDPWDGGSADVLREGR